MNLCMDGVCRIHRRLKVYNVKIAADSEAIINKKVHVILYSQLEGHAHDKYVVQYYSTNIL